jgi:hypothetical protein
MIYKTLAGMCKETHFPAVANGLGVRPPEHQWRVASASPWIRSDALTQFSGTRPEGSVHSGSRAWFTQALPYLYCHWAVGRPDFWSVAPVDCYVAWPYPRLGFTS